MHNLSNNDINLFQKSLIAAKKVVKWLEENQSDETINEIIKENPNGGFTKRFDFEAQELLVEELIDSRATIFAEESKWKDKVSSGEFVIIDPVDGSANYEKGSPFYCISLAGGFSECQPTHNDIIWGIVVSPLFGIWTFKKGAGVFFDNKPLYKPRVPKVSVLRHPRLSAKKREKVIVLGSTALELCFLANGYIDLFIGLWPLKLVDYAAGYGIIKELGGHIYDLNGNTIDNEKISFRSKSGLTFSFSDFSDIRGYV